MRRTSSLRFRRAAGLVIPLLLALLGYWGTHRLLQQNFEWNLPTRASFLQESGEPSGATDPAPSVLLGLPPDLLEDLGQERYRSPAGLIYGPGSAEGHRLEHVRRRLEDIPERRGPHGVFLAPLPRVIGWIDQVYRDAEAGASHVTRRIEGRRTILEAKFSHPLGFVGGRTGASRGHPETRRLRLVLEGNRVITAFPF